ASLPAQRRPAIWAQKYGTKRCGPGQTRRLTGTAFGRVIVTGGLIRRRRNLGPLCYVAVTVGLIHRPAGTVEKPLAIGFPREVDTGASSDCQQSQSRVRA